MSSSTELHDVAVVGGGPVGMLLACALAGAGIDVVVLERRPDPGGRTRAVGIHPPGLAALAAVGVGDGVLDTAHVILEGVATCRGRELGRISFVETPIRTLPQRRTEELLEARLAALSPGSLRREVDVTALRDRGTHVEVTTQTSDEAGALCARYVVGADGVRSTVRGLLGIDWVPRGRSAYYAMSDGTDTTDFPDTAVLHLEPAGIVESFPLPAGRRRWVARLSGDTGAGSTDAVPDVGSFSALVRERVAVDLTDARLSAPSGFRARQHVAAGFTHGRVVLVGDAAHEISPMGGQGMNLGWLGAVHLARVLSGVLAGRATAADLDGWARAQRSRALRATRQASFNMAMGAPRRGAALEARNALARVLTAPACRRRLAETFTMSRF